MIGTATSFLSTAPRLTWDGCADEHLVLETSRGPIAARQSPAAGCPILLISDRDAGISSFDGLFAHRLAQRHHLVAPDLSTLGRPTGRPGRFAKHASLEVADAAVEIAEKLGLEQPIVLGAGSGVHIAISIAASWPGVRALCLLGSEATVRIDRLSGELVDVAGTGDPRGEGQRRTSAGASTDLELLHLLRALPVASFTRDADRAWPRTKGSTALWQGGHQLVPGRASLVAEPACFALLRRFLADVEAQCAYRPSWYTLSA